MYYYYYCKKEVHQNIFEAKRLFGVDAEKSTSSYLLTFFVMVAMVTVENKWWTLIGEWIIRKMTLVETCCYEANELIFAEL